MLNLLHYFSNIGEHAVYETVQSERLGRSSSKEQYGFIYRYLYVEGRLVKNNMDLYTGTYMWKVISNSDYKYSIVVGDII